MPSKKEKHHQQQQQQVLTNTKAQTLPLANSTNTTSTNTYQTVTTNHVSTVTTKKSQFNHDTTQNSNPLSLIRDQKQELDGLNNRFSIYVDALLKKSKENDDLQKKVDVEKQKTKTLSNQDHNDLESQMDKLRTDIDESAVFTEHWSLKRNRALKDLALLKEKIRNEEDPSFANRRQLLETEYQQSLIQLKELTRRYEDLVNFSRTNQTEINQLTDLYNKLEDELHDLILNNLRLECQRRTIEEKILFTKALYETEKADYANEQIKQQQFYTNELDKAIEDIKLDFQTLLKKNKVTLENAYTERIEQVKTQILTYEANKQQETPMTSRISRESLHEELKQTEKLRDNIENEYRPLIDIYLSKQKEKNQIDEERFRLDSEYNRLISEINQITEAIELGKQHSFSIHFELETYRRILDLETKKFYSNHLVNGKVENGISENQTTPIINTKKIETQRSISKSGEIKTIDETSHSNEGSILIYRLILGKFDIDQVQVGFISINNAAKDCIDQSLKGWTLVRTSNNDDEQKFQFPDAYILKAKTRVRVYSNKTENNSSIQGRLIASNISAWASAGQGDNVKIILLDEKGINRAEYCETWQ